MSEVHVISEKNEATEVPADGVLPLLSKITLIENSAQSKEHDFEVTEKADPLAKKNTKSVPTGVRLKENIGNGEIKQKEEVKYEVELKNSALCKSSGRNAPKHQAPLSKANSKSWAVRERQQEVWGYWYQPKVADTYIRSKNYLTSRLKIPNGAPPLLELTHFDFFHINDRVDNLGSHKNSWLNRGCPHELKNRKFLIINIQVTAMSVMLVQYFVFNERGSTGCERVNKMWADFVKGSDSFRDQTLKLIPIIVEGPWLVRNSVPTRPCIIGTKVKNRYFQSGNYFEVDIETDASLIAKGVLSLLQGYSNYSVNLIWILEAITYEELPERILAAAHLGYPDYKKAISLETS